MLSVLTEPEAFGGSLQLLQSVAAEARVPVLCKDFLVDPYQVFEARVAGADGVLVIARILSDEAMAAILRRGGSNRHVRPGGGVRRIRPEACLDATPRVGVTLFVGVNCRDLETLRTEPSIHGELAAGLPDRPPSVAESGILDPADIRRVAGLGYRGALVGLGPDEVDDPAGMMASMLAAGRETVEGGRLLSLFVKLCGLRTPQADVETASTPGPMQSVS